jgi:hypothetical protein
MERTWRPTTAGILTIVAGVLNLIVGIIVVSIGAAVVAPLCGLWGFTAVGAPIIVLGIISIVGGIFALRRRVWGMALAGAICALFPPPIAVLGILAIVFVALSQEEFAKA